MAVRFKGYDNSIDLQKNIIFDRHYERGLGSLVTDRKLRMFFLCSQLTELTLFCFYFLALQTECSQCCGRLYSFDYEHHHPAAISDSKVKQIPLPLGRKKKLVSLRQNNSIREK